MFGKIYLQDGMKVFLKDSIAAREINCVFKEAFIELENDNICLERSGKRVSPDYDDTGIEQDENGFFIFLGDD